MKKIFQILSMAVIVMAAVSCGTPDITYSDEPLAAVQLNGKWGYIDTKGNEVIPYKYDRANEFSDGLAAVKLNERWMYIDKTGKVIIKLDKKHQSAAKFSEGLAWVGNDYIDKTGKEVISLKDKDNFRKYYDARAFHDGRAAVQDKERRWGFIDTTGTEIIPCKYEEVIDFSGGRAFVSSPERRYRDQSYNYYTERDNHILDVNGKVIGSWKKSQNTGKPVEISKDESTIEILRHEGNYAVIKDWNGGKTPFKYIRTRSFSEGMIAVAERQEDVLTVLWGFVNDEAREVIPCKYYKVNDFSDGYAAAMLPEKYVDEYFGSTKTRGGKWGLIDKTGKTIVPFKYSTDYRDSQTIIRYVDETKIHFIHFSDDMALVLSDGKYGYVDKSGNEVIPCQYKDGKDFSDGFAKVKKMDGKWSFIDKTGREIVNESDELIFSNGLCAVQRSGKWGFIDRTGKEVIPCKYEGAENFN